MDEAVQSIINQLKTYQPEKIILFGSYVYGKPGQNSDLDIAVIKSTKDSFHERQRKTRLLIKSTIPIDIFVFTPEEFKKAKKNNLFVKEIAKMGRVIYG